MASPPPLTEWQLDEDRFVALLGKLIGEARYLQNNPPECIPKEDRAVRHVLDVLQPYSDEAGGPLEIRHVRYVEGRGNLIITYPGGDPNSDKILSFVGCHMDVVTANPDDWDFDPFSLTRDGDKLRGRGTTDCLGHVALVTDLLRQLAIHRPVLSSSVVVVLIANEENATVKDIGVDGLVKNGLMDHLKNGPLCIISGGDHLPIFSSPLSGPTSGWLRLSYLQLQRAQGGVFDRMRTAINASRCVFVGNTAGGMGGAVLIDMFPSSSSSSSSSPPARSFSDCAFQSNLAPLLGGAVANVNSGNPLARAPSLLFLRCSFRGNEAPRSLGGAIAVAGAGRMRLQGCVFEGNTAGASGGAIFSYGTSLAIAFTAFRNNKALGTAPGGSFTTGAGGAAFVISGLTGRPTAAAFCSASFSGNTGAVASGGSVFFQKAPGNSPLGATVTFCGGSRPSSGLFLPKNGWAVGKTCSPTTCK